MENNKIVKWRVVINLVNGESLYARPTSWREVVVEARLAFQTQYLVGAKQYAYPVSVDVDGVWAEGAPTHVVTWHSLEDVDNGIVERSTRESND